MTLLSTVLAQDGPGGGTITDPTTLSGLNTNLTLGGLISWAMVAILVVAGLAFFFMLIFGGIRWILSGGDKANTEAARNQVTAAIIGLIIVFGSYIIINLVEGIFNVDIFGNLDSVFNPIAS